MSLPVPVSATLIRDLSLLHTYSLGSKHLLNIFLAIISQIPLFFCVLNSTVRLIYHTDIT